MNVVHIHLPPLRRRKEDIPLLVDYFLSRFREELGKNVMGISREALEHLMEYDWLGNVRELENRLKRAVVLSRSDTLTPENILPDSEGIRKSAWRKEEVEDKLGDCFRQIFQIIRQNDDDLNVMETMEHHIILEALKETGGNQSQAARLLGMNRNTLRNKIRGYGIDGSRVVMYEKSE